MMNVTMDITEAEDGNEEYADRARHDPDVPLQKCRSRTDICWFISFIFYLVVWTIVIIYAFTNGDTNKWIRPADTEGRTCGNSPGVYYRPYLVEYNLDNCQTSNCLACWAQCPNASFTYASRENITGDTENETLIFEATKKLMICKPEVKIYDLTSWTQLTYLVDAGKCARNYEKSTPVNFRCDVDDSERFDGWRKTLPRIVQDISNAKYSILGFVTLSGLMSLISIILMRWHALYFISGSIFALCAIAFHFVYKSCVNNAKSKTNGVLLSLFLCVVILVIIVLIALYYRRQISLGCQMIKESIKAIVCIRSSLLVPLILIIVYILCLTLGVSVFFALTTIEYPVYRANFDENESCKCSSYLDYSTNSTCNPDIFESQCETLTGGKCFTSGCYMVGNRRKSAGFLHFLNLLGLYWSYWFVLGFGDCVLASIFGTWYWSFNKNLLTHLVVAESFRIVGIFHIGTVAFGSLILFFCTIIRCVLSITYKCLQKINKPATELILLNFRCIFDALEGFLNFVDRRAYVVCATQGTDFIQSARTAYYTLMRNINRVIAIFEITDWLIIMLTILIACINTTLSISYYGSRTDDLWNTATPAWIVFLGSLVVVRFLMRIVELAVHSIFQCFLEDTERNDGSSEKPNLMVEEFNKFLYKQ